MSNTKKILLFLANLLLVVGRFVVETFMFMCGWNWFIVDNVPFISGATFWLTAGIVAMLSYITASRTDKQVWDSVKFEEDKQKLSEKEKLSQGLLLSGIRFTGVVLMFIVLFIFHLFT